MSANPGFAGISEPDHSSTSQGRCSIVTSANDAHSVHGKIANISEAAHARTKHLSPWACSKSKRLFDLAFVGATLPLVLPVFLITAAAVRLTSSGPVLFRQKRMGRAPVPFTIFKFRTMPVKRQASDRPAVTTSSNQRFTPVGAFLRRWKLDELPQIINILRGDMSLVGPRPKLLKHQPSCLKCRPGITGRATVAFAREEIALSKVPSSHLDAYYHGVILPFKQMLDDEYMAQATFASDLKLILKSIFRHWDNAEIAHLLANHSQPARPALHASVSKPHPGPVALPRQGQSPRQES